MCFNAEQVSEKSLPFDDSFPKCPQQSGFFGDWMEVVDVREASLFLFPGYENGGAVLEAAGFEHQQQRLRLGGTGYSAEHSHIRAPAICCILCCYRIASVGIEVNLRRTDSSCYIRAHRKLGWSTWNQLGNWVLSTWTTLSPYWQGIHDGKTRAACLMQHSVTSGERERQLQILLL